MVSWRDSASEGAQRDLDGLLTTAINVAQGELEKRGEFLPFAVVVEGSGELALTSVDAGDGQPDSDAILADLTRGLVAQRGELRAAALVADVRTVDPVGEAIQVVLEHSEGVVLAVRLPYERSGEGFVYGDLAAAAAVGSIWSV